MSGVIVANIELIAQMRYGPAGAPNAAEKGMIEPTLARMLSRIPKRRAQQMTQMMDPAILAMGVVMYGRRLAELETRKERTSVVNQAQNIVNNHAQTLNPTPPPNPVSRDTPIPEDAKPPDTPAVSDDIRNIMEGNN